MRLSVLRVLDVNFNRAREALRVLEEHTRFVLNDPALTERAKTLRHQLAEALTAFGPEALLAARDTPNDVGTRISTDSEVLRGSPRDVATAAAKRAGESLRCIEEYGKTLNAGAAAQVEQIRYRIYSLEQDILVGGWRRKRLIEARLHVLATESLCRGPWLTVCEKSLRGGADVLQLREKNLPDGELLSRAEKLRDLTREHGAMLIINDRADIARLSGADGVHVGRHDLPVSAARQIGGPNLIIGRSTHSADEARAALNEGPDYIAVGPMFSSPTKPQVRVQGPELLREALAISNLPVVAIGGITADNAATILETPRRGHASPVQIAVCQAVISAEDPEGAARGLIDKINERRRRDDAVTERRPHDGSVAPIAP